MESKRPAISISDKDYRCIPLYATISIAFEVSEVFDAATIEPGSGIAFWTIQPQPLPYLKNYDDYAVNGPLHWPSSFNVSAWRFLIAYRGTELAGGAVVVGRQDSIAMLEDRSDLAVLWDMRVAPAFRRRRIGSALLNSAEHVARGAGAKELKVETQNINVPACRFYERHGFTLGKVRRDAYPGLPAETQLFWYKSL